MLHRIETLDAALGCSTNLSSMGSESGLSSGRFKGPAGAATGLVVAVNFPDGDGVVGTDADIAVAATAAATSGSLPAENVDGSMGTGFPILASDSATTSKSLTIQMSLLFILKMLLGRLLSSFILMIEKSKG